MKKKLSIILMLIIIFSANPNIGNQVYGATKIKLSKTKITLSVGKSTTLKLKGTSKKPKWTSSNKKIVTVSKKGKIVAKKKGKAVVKAKLKGKTYKCKVTVVKKQSVATVDYDSKVVKSLVASEKNYDVVENNDNLSITLKSNSKTKQLKVGDVVVLPGNDEYEGGIAIKINNISSKENNIQLDGTVPAVNEVFDNIKINKEVKASFDNVDINKKSVQSIKPLGKDVDIRFGKIVGDKMEIILNKDDFGENGKNGNIEGKIIIDAPIINADIDVNIDGANTKVKKLNIDIENKITQKLDLNIKANEYRKYLGSINSISVGNGFYVDVLMYLVMNADGKATLQYTMTNNTGIKYSSNSVKPYSKITNSIEGTQGECNAKILLNPLANLRFLGIWDDKDHEAICDVPIIGLNTDIGPGLHAKVASHNKKPFSCVDLTIYAFTDLSIPSNSLKNDGVGYLISKLGLNTSWILLDNNDDNKFRKSIHIEDGIKVSNCTFDGKDIIDINSLPKDFTGIYDGSNTSFFGLITTVVRRNIEIHIQNIDGNNISGIALISPYEQDPESIVSCSYRISGEIDSETGNIELQGYEFIDKGNAGDFSFVKLSGKISNDGISGTTDYGIWEMRPM